MNSRMFRRILAIFLLCLSGFLIGYHNVYLSVFFLNQKSLTGLLVVGLILLIIYCYHLKEKILRIKIAHEHDVDKLYNYRDMANGYKHVKDQYKEIKSLLIGTNPRIEELKNSLLLRQDIIDSYAKKNDLLIKQNQLLEKEKNRCQKQLLAKNWTGQESDLNNQLKDK